MKNLYSKITPKTWWFTILTHEKDWRNRLIHFYGTPALALNRRFCWQLWIMKFVSSFGLLFGLVVCSAKIFRKIWGKVRVAGRALSHLSKHRIRILSHSRFTETETINTQGNIKYTHSILWVHTIYCKYCAVQLKMLSDIVETTSQVEIMFQKINDS